MYIKLICSKLKLLLGSVINHTQDAFVEGRYISHNILLCQDLVRHYSKKSCYPSCLIKVDLRKSYKTMDWFFFEDMLFALNFPPHLIKFIMVCIIPTNYSLSLNGSTLEIFQPKRGLRQRDLMSPLLFVIRVEYLSRIMIKVSYHNMFKFHPRC